MAFTSFGGLATILVNGPSFKAATTEAVSRGDLINKEFGLADASATKLPAKYVALEDAASGDTIEFAQWAVIRKPSTIAAGGAVTAGDHSGTLGDTLFLSTTGGDAVDVIDGDGIYQVVGQVLSTEDALLEPSFAPGDFFEDCEKETAAKTIDAADSGKAIVCVSTSDIVVTLPATAVEGWWTIVNGAQDGDHLVSISPNGNDAVTGWDGAGTDDKDFSNTKATSKAGDYMTIMASGLASGVKIAGGRGVWAAEA